MWRVDLGAFMAIAGTFLPDRSGRLLVAQTRIELAQAALQAPFSGFGSYEAFPGFELKAAILCSRIATYHALPDANKRTAYMAMTLFVQENGRLWVPRGSDDERASMIEGIAARAIPEELFAHWVAERIETP